MSLTYESYIDAIARLLVVPANDPAFLAFVPDMIDYAEQRIYRELDLLATTQADSSKALTANTRILALPTDPRFTVVQGVNVITPAGATPASGGTRVPLVPVTKEFLDMSWPGPGYSAVPAFFAMVTDQSIMVGPWPDQAYTVEIIGTGRPKPLTASSTPTVLSQFLPDLFVAASMVFASGRERNFGAQADDPKMAQSWEQQYQTLFASANGEELRKKFSGQAGTSSSQPVVGASSGAAGA